MNASTKAYVVVIAVQLIYTGMFVISKAAFDHGIDTYVFMFYRQAAGSLLLLPLALLRHRSYSRNSMSSWMLFKLFMFALLGITFSMNLYHVSLKFTSATVASATDNSLPAVTFFLALLLRMEHVKLKSWSGAAKLTGVALCLAGVLVIAFYAGPSMSPVNHHRAFASHASGSSGANVTRGAWVKWTFLMVLADAMWSLWIVLQAPVLKECPDKILVTAVQCFFSTVQSFVVAMVAERDFSRWKLSFDISLLAIFYAEVPTEMDVVIGTRFMELKFAIEPAEDTQGEANKSAAPKDNNDDDEPQRKKDDDVGDKSKKPKHTPAGSLGNSNANQTIGASSSGGPMDGAEIEDWEDEDDLMDDARGAVDDHIDDKVVADPLAPANQMDRDELIADGEKKFQPTGTPIVTPNLIVNGIGDHGNLITQANSQNSIPHGPFVALGPMLDKALKELKDHQEREEKREASVTSSCVEAIASPIQVQVKEKVTPRRRSKRREESVDEDSIQRAARLTAIRNLEIPGGYIQRDILDPLLGYAAEEGGTAPNLMGMPCA
ncbi:unnamed protein product [Urochloa decumbens]|uniref:EamA domain-containing protein n=1 Tax=Urochloa decumbens TaxID=240449 RepID=A0ABC8VSU5_9POAL